MKTRPVIIIVTKIKKDYLKKGKGKRFLYFYDYFYDYGYDMTLFKQAESNYGKKKSPANEFVAGLSFSHCLNFGYR